VVVAALVRLATILTLRETSGLPLAATNAERDDAQNRRTATAGSSAEA
jgi:hypothetical protein